jgi:Icc-related predicted phosphoesterase
VRILLVSDLHYTLPQWDWVVGAAPQYDLVVVAGDLLDVNSSVAVHAQSLVVLRYLSLLHGAGQVAVSSGNHDLTGPDPAGEQAALWLAEARAVGIPTDGDSLTVGDTLVTICPWWDGPIGRDTVERQLAGDAGRRDYGDPDLAGWIDRYRPDLVLTGHVHQSPFKPDGSWADRRGDTWVFNAGRQIGPIPAHIALDPSEGWATWTSLMGTEQVMLADATGPRRTVC